MKWREVLERLQDATEEELESPAFVSCDPEDTPPEIGLRYQGILDGIQSCHGELQAYYVGATNIEAGDGEDSGI